MWGVFGALAGEFGEMLSVEGEGVKWGKLRI